MAFGKVLPAAIVLTLIAFNTSYADDCRSFLQPESTEESYGSPDINVDLEEKEAIVWYLGHSGWAVKTKSHLLIFDYWERIKKPEAASLAQGYIDPAEIKDLKVIVFVSHSHGDHYDPVILEWEKTIPDITYVFGWKALDNPEYIYCDYKREKKSIDDVEVMTVVHDFDNIPESAFLVKLDGLVIFHSGDHGSGRPPFRPLFLENIEYLTQIAPDIDMAFIPQFGEELYVAEKLKAKFTFPMHGGGRERDYKKLAEKVLDNNIPTKIICAEKKGEKFTYKNGEIE